MQFVVLATDFDGTLAHDGVVPGDAIRALLDVRRSGRRLVLVTGRRLPELIETFPEAMLFDRIVAENGIVLFDPGSGDQSLLGPPVPDKLVDELEARGVAPLARGEGILATWRPHETAAFETIRDLGFDYHIAFNKDAVMLLPAGITKATGLSAALRTLEASRHNTVAVGDAENDHALLAASELGVAVANAVPSLLAAADAVTSGRAAAGLIEVAQRLVNEDLASWERKSGRRRVLLGELGDDVPSIPAHGPVVLVAGPSESGKSTLATRLIAQLVAQDYQLAVIDPEGDYDASFHTAVAGSPQSPPAVDTAIQVLADPAQSLIVNLLAVPGTGRQAVFHELLRRVRELRTRHGRPHWLVIDEAHHMLYGPLPAPELLRGDAFRSVVLLTVHPGALDPAVLSTVTHVVSLGRDPGPTLAEFCALRGFSMPAMPRGECDRAGVLWEMGTPATIDIPDCPQRRRSARHARKYAEGDLGPERSFYFRGPGGASGIVARNLTAFVDLAGQVDDPTWHYHLSRGDFARWFRDCIGDDTLAEAAEELRRHEIAPRETRRLLSEFILSRYAPSA